ncbi:MFS transporter [Actinomadura roseirufa]|uniref:MFS transporter n=1 Tax=Actinomadura roseirufa TaxID=2094049 RepID=UPI001040FA1A|nr:MFS transporter [Actinomadura roseirufa]
MRRAATDAPPSRTSAGRGTRGLLLVLSGTMLLDALEVSTTVVALPAAGADLGSSPAAAQWLMSGFALGFGGLLPSGGRLVGLFGRRRVYLAALAGFAAASLLCGLASHAGPLVAGRVVKGLCVALTAPTGLAVIGAEFPEGPARARALSLYSLAGAGGFCAGLPLSGLLTEASWRWTFLFPVPVAAALLALGWFRVPSGPPGGPAAAGARIRGVTGAVLFLTAAGLVLWGIQCAGRAAWPAAAGSLAGAALLTAAAAALERSVPRPLLRRRVLANASLVRSAVGAAALNGPYWGLLFLLTFQWQSRAGWSPLETALAFLPAALPLALAAPRSGRLVSRFGARRLIVAGALAPPLGYALYLPHASDPSYAAHVLPTLLLVGAGFVLQFTALHTQALAGVPDRDRPMTTAVYQAAVQLGGALALTLTVALLPAEPWPRAGAGDPGPAALFITALSAAGLAAALAGHRRKERHGRRPGADPARSDRGKRPA